MNLFGVLVFSTPWLFSLPSLTTARIIEKVRGKSSAWVMSPKFVPLFILPYFRMIEPPLVPQQAGIRPNDRCVERVSKKGSVCLRPTQRAAQMSGFPTVNNWLTKRQTALIHPNALVVLRSSMLALHKVPRGCASLARVRGNATVAAGSAPDTVKSPPPAQPQAAATASSPSPAPRPAKAKAAADTGKEAAGAASQPDANTRGRRVWPTSRPSITLERPRQYMRPIGVGVLPVYDRALELIKKDSRILQHELSSLKKELQDGESKKSPEEVEKLKAKAKILEIQSEINIPSVRWKARNGLGAYHQIRSVLVLVSPVV